MTTNTETVILSKIAGSWTWSVGGGEVDRLLLAMLMLVLPL